MTTILNLGCGTKTSTRPEVVNIDWSIYLRIRRHAVLRFLSRRFLRGERLRRLDSLPDSVLVHNLAKGIPFASGSVDAVYHSHFLEHLDREDAREFLREVRRVLRKGGVQRIVVPDFERLCKRYLESIELCDCSLRNGGEHGRYIADIIEQMVRKVAHGSSQQPALRRFIENLLLGDARRRGETHRWMYDRISLGSVLTELGYATVTLQGYATSYIDHWSSFGLDVDESGREYKPGSLYVEAVK